MVQLAQERVDLLQRHGLRELRAGAAAEDHFHALLSANGHQLTRDVDRVNVGRVKYILLAIKCISDSQLCITCALPLSEVVIHITPSCETDLTVHWTQARLVLLQTSAGLPAANLM